MVPQPPVRQIVKQPIDQVLTIPQPPITQIYNQVYRKPVMIPQPPVVQTNFQKIQRSVIVPQPPLIQNQTRVYEQGTYIQPQMAMGMVPPQIMANQFPNMPNFPINGFPMQCPI